MATGYTAKIKDGISFNEFVMDCARAFGACVSLRDESGGGEKIPEEFSPRIRGIQDNIAQNKYELAKLLEMSEEDCEAAADKEYVDERNHLTQMRLETLDLKDKYEDMLIRVCAWTPPTKDHQGLKDFMIDQLGQSIAFDCSDSYMQHCDPNKVVKKSATEWKESKAEKLKWNLSFYEEQLEMSINQANQATDWVKQLRGSLRNS